METILTVMGLFVSIGIALHQRYQTNQLHFFDQRIKVIDVMECIYQNVSEQSGLLQKTAESTENSCSDVPFVLLMNNYLMYECQGKVGEKEFQSLFWLKRSEIRRIIKHAHFLFSREDAVLCEEFIDAYFECLIKNYQMQCCLRNIYETNTNLGRYEMTRCNSASAQKVDEENNRLLQSQSEKIREAYKVLLECLHRIEEKRVLMSLTKKAKVQLWSKYRLRPEPEPKT